MTDQRQHPRFRCEASAEIHAHDTFAKLGIVSDISKSGGYVETVSPLALHEEFVLVLHAFDFVVNLQARVMVVHPLLGMGVEFTANSPEDEKVLEALLTRVAEPPTVEPSEPEAAPPIFAPLRITRYQAVPLAKAIEKHFRQNDVLSREEVLGMLKEMPRH